MKKKELENILDQVTAGIRRENVDSAVVNQTAERVWARVAVAADAGSPRADHAHAVSAPTRIEGCADFQSLIPVYLRGELSEARSLLLVDHTHECIPCRKALKQARESRIQVAPVQTRVRREARSQYSLRPVVLRWGIAAALIIGLGLIAWPFIERYVPVGSFEATVQAADGPVYLVSGSEMRLVNSGEKIGRGQTIRTAKDAHAVVRLGDGSTIEMKDRSELSMNQTLRGTTLNLDRGSLIVEAAKQKDRMFVNTGDSLVSVTGTTFAVNAGTKGSRVSVIEGEVRLDSNLRNPQPGNTSQTQSESQKKHRTVLGKLHSIFYSLFHSKNAPDGERVLHAGEQATTNQSIETIPVKDEVAWSRNATRYSQILEGLAALRRDLGALPKPGVRNSTRLLDMMPENTVLYAAVPNLASTIAESNRIIEERIQQNPALRDWFQNRPGPKGPAVNHAIATIKEFGEQLGDEIAVGAGMDDQGQPAAPIVIAQLKNPAGFHAFFDSEVQKLGKAPNVQWVEDARTAKAANTSSAEAGKTNENELYFWITGDVLVASPKLDRLQTVAKGGSGFSATPFYARIAEVYREGAGLVIAADLEKIIAHTRGLRRMAAGDQHEQALNQLGVFNMKSFVLDQKDSDGKTHTRAVLSYNQTDHGITSWLAQPAPMGALEYISADANLVAGFVIKNPTAVVDDLLSAVNNVCPDLNKHLDELQKDHGLNVRHDFAAPLGGEYAFAIDGPVLPTPSWKLVIQVNDPARLQQTFETVVTEVNKHAESVKAVKEGQRLLEWDRAQVGGHTFYTLRAKDPGVEVNYVFANGYLIAGPTRALVQEALRYHDSGATLVHSSKFTEGLPADGNVNFSALVYHNLAPLVQPFANRIADTKALPEDQQKMFSAMAANMQPTLAYAYAYSDRVEFASNTEGGPFGLSPASLLGMPNAFELQHILDQGMRGGFSR